MLNVGVFTDNDFEKVNGVTTSLRAAIDHAPSDVHVRVYTCDASGLETPQPREVATIEQVRAARKVVGSVYIDDRVRDYIVHVVQATRRPRDYGLAELAPLIEFGGSPRATLCLAAAARAHAFIQHRAYVTPDDIKAIALDVMRHRVQVTYEAEA